ncbi:MAG: ABC transporter permease, partial [Ilumatobacteraceae bacterium]
MAEHASAAPRPTLLVARREFREAIAMKSFWITLILTAAVLVAIIVIAELSGGSGDEAERVVIGGDSPAEQVDSVERLGAAIGIQLEVIMAADDLAAEAAVLAGDADVAILAGGTRLATKEEVDGTSRLGAVVNALRADIALQNGLRAAGLDPQQAAAVRATAPPPVQALDPGQENSGSGVATVTNILLFVLLQTYGAWVLTAVTREKASRVVEVLLAVIRPIHLLVGKIIGIGSVALVHAATLI